MKYCKVLWKRNLRKAPDGIRRKLRLMEGSIIAAVVRKVPLIEIADGKYEHIGLTLVDGRCVCKERILPRSIQGRYSRRNRSGYTVVYRNRPKVTRTYSFEAPNWGDWWRGSHTVFLDREVFEREFQGPKLLDILVEILGEDAGFERAVIVRFSVDQVLARSTKAFQRDLFFNLNLLQENVGACDVYPTNASLEEYLSTIYVHWEILPPGSREGQINLILGANSQLSPRERREFEERFDFLMRLRPNRLVRGTSGFRRYFGALFAEDLVVFENVEYGNAIYIMFEDWEELSRRTRLELLNGVPGKFVRVVHRRGWKERVAQILKERRRSADWIDGSSHN